MEIKQPQLGKKISELRKAKGLTQEELVEKCNLNVRTIQRIEAGEVTPRSYTIKALFEALDFQWEADRIVDENQAKPKPIYLYLAFGAGLLYFFLAFYEIGMEYEWIEAGVVNNKPAFTAIKLITGVSYLCFLGGLLALEQYFPNKILKIALWVMIGFNVVLYSLDMLALHSTMLNIQDYYWIKLEAFGLAYAFLGASYLAFKQVKYGLAQVIGALGLIAGILIFSGIGVLFGLLPLTFFEIGQLGLMIYFIQKIGRPSSPDSPAIG
ncbi:helix-turn-helix domain-containing protein [Algoriphagus sp.]|uniref:helix-turn-helix domain-containing protein n=1 Tax=Algoriphagus sp. TaxID=1872435 RepID=UPI0026186419|nr:helix-turn-helix domain-containing protein [Algoriphagus sp.]